MQQLPQVVQLRKAKPQHGRSKGLDCPAWIEQEFRTRQQDKRMAEIRKQKQRNAALNSAKAFAAGCAFVIFALATTVVR